MLAASGDAAKGRMRPLLDAIPVHVVMNDKTAFAWRGSVCFQRCGNASGLRVDDRI